MFGETRTGSVSLATPSASCRLASRANSNLLRFKDRTRNHFCYSVVHDLPRSRSPPTHHTGFRLDFHVDERIADEHLLHLGISAEGKVT